MKANQCDRCGQLYKKTENPKYGLIVFSESKSRNKRSVDLCPQCLIDLDNWYNKMVIRGGEKND